MSLWLVHHLLCVGVKSSLDSYFIPLLVDPRIFRMVNPMVLGEIIVGGAIVQMQQSTQSTPADGAR